MSDIPLLIRIDETKARFAEVLEALDGLGFSVRMAVEELGVVTGVIDLEALPLVRAIAGVSGVQDAGAAESILESAAETAEAA